MAHTKITTRNITDDAVTSAKLDTNIDIAGTLAIGGGLSIPSTITHVGDTDTKLDFNQANTMRLITGGNTAWIANASSLVINEDSIDFDFRVESNGNANMLFVDGGNDAVGIGTDTIDNNATLHIEDSAYPVINLDRSASLADGNHLGYINFQNNGDVYGHIGGWVEDVSETDGELHFATQKDTSLTTKMVITSDGYVGIGATSPIEKMHVNGQIMSSASNSTSATAGVERAIIDLSSHIARVGHFRGTESAGSGEMSLWTDSVERVRIDESGWVGIGTQTPAALLDVRTGSGTYSHFGGIPVTNTHYTGITFGYSEAGSASYRKSGIAQEQIGDGAARGHMHFLTDIASDGNSVTLADSKMKIHGTTGYVIPRMNFHYALSSVGASQTTTGDESSSGAGILILKQQISVNADSKIIVWADSGQISASSTGGYNPQMVIYVTSNSSAPPSRGESHGINSSTQHRWYPINTSSNDRLFLYAHGATGTLTPGTYYIYVYGGSYNGGTMIFNSQATARSSSIVWAEVMV